MIAVIIPTHNRPELLHEAVASVYKQTYNDWEIVIVDDGSQPPVDVESLRRRFDSRIRVIRNEQPMKLCYARDQGVRSAVGEIIVQLDDDDLLAPEALETALAALKSDPSLELVYLNVEGFGERAAHFKTAQDSAIQGVFKHVNAQKSQHGAVQFGSELFGELLRSVPMAFQRSIVYRSVWEKVSSLREQVYMLDSDILDAEQARRRICPPLRDSEWALYAAASCKAALLTVPIYLQRCEGQGAVSQPSQKQRAIVSNIDIKAHLFNASKVHPEFKPWSRSIRENYSQALFEQAYFYFYTGSRLAAYSALANSIRIQTRLPYLRFGLRMLLPAGNAESVFE